VQPDDIEQNKVQEIDLQVQKVQQKMSENLGKLQQTYPLFHFFFAILLFITLSTHRVVPNFDTLQEKFFRRENRSNHYRCEQNPSERIHMSGRKLLNNCHGENDFVRSSSSVHVSEEK
jgi:hypothetical protein